MRLRDHPLMRHHGAHNWPPVWTQVRKEAKQTVTGEVGILKYVNCHPISNKCYLVIEHNSDYFVGTLICDDEVFCAQVATILQKHLGRSIKEIGDADVSHTL